MIWKQILIFFFPILFGTFFQQPYNTADDVIVGRFIEKEALSAVGGSSGTLINMLIVFLLFPSIYGAKKREDVSYSVHTL